MSVASTLRVSCVGWEEVLEKPACALASPATAAPLSARSEERTIPSNRGAAVSGTRASHTPDAPEGRSSVPVPLERRRAPEWCVDLGASLQSMSTFELWTALATGHVPRSARVWREGMECWTPALEVADLACAIAEVHPEPRPSLRAADLEALVRDLGPDTLSPLDPEAALDAQTPVPVVRPHVVEAAPEPTASGFVARARAGARPVALGAMVAAAAVTFALASQHPRASLFEPAISGLGAAGTTASLAVALQASTTQMAPPPTRVALAETARRPPALKSDRGQKRLRTGKRK